MTNHGFPTGRISAVLMALAAVGSIAALFVSTASADGRTLQGNFCSNNHFCMSLTFGDATFNSATDRTDPTQPDVTLRPGTYWINVTDNSNFHNFALRSCPGSTSHCVADPSDPSAGVQDLTPICNDPLTAAGKCPTTNPASNEIDDTIKVNLTHGTYRLFCQAPNHEGLGMYVDIAVGGVGQVG